MSLKEMPAPQASRTAPGHLHETQATLALMYFNGIGVLKDEAEAVRWWRLAAAQDNAILGQFADEGVDLSESQWRPPLQIAADETVIMDVEFECSGRGILDGGDTVFFGQGEQTRIRRMAASPWRRWMALASSPM